MSPLNQIRSNNISSINKFDHVSKLVNLDKKNSNQQDEYSESQFEIESIEDLDLKPSSEMVLNKRLTEKKAEFKILVANDCQL